MIQDTLERHVTTTRPAAQRARKMVAEPQFVQLPLSHFPLLAPVVARLAALAAAAPVEGVLKPPVEPPPAKCARVATRQPVPLNLLFEEYRFVPKVK